MYPTNICVECDTQRHVEVDAPDMYTKTNLENDTHEKNKKILKKEEETVCNLKPWKVCLLLTHLYTLSCSQRDTIVTSQFKSKNNNTFTHKIYLYLPPS